MNTLGPGFLITLNISIMGVIASLGGIFVDSKELFYVETKLSNNI